MDKEIFDKKVKEYMLLSKRTLAEMLAISELSKPNEIIVGGDTVTVTTMKIGECPAATMMCSHLDCNECLFNERRKELERKMFDESRMFLVDPRNLPQYTRTDTGDFTGGFVTTVSTETDIPKN